VPAYFESAPTERFLGALNRLGTLPAGDRTQIATTVFARIEQFFGSNNAEDLRGIARAAQDERWRAIYNGNGKPTDVGFASVVLVEQWALAKRETVASASSVAAVLAERRRSAIEAFIDANMDRSAARESS